MTDREQPCFAIALAGPTASGKTDLAIELTRRFPMEIISVDASQVYRGMNIGTAKPDVGTLAKAPHRLIDIRDPSDTYSAADFYGDALREMDEIASAGRIPLLTGGTMFYFSVLDRGLPELPQANADIRDRLTGEAQRSGWPHLHQQLAAVDAASAARISPTDGQRIQRALEVYELTGSTVTELSNAARARSPWTIAHLAIAPGDRRVLHDRIARRFDQMLEDGLIEEVQNLLNSGRLRSSDPTSRTVGYRQVIAYLEGDCSRSQMIASGVAATRQLAKRQLTWLRNRAGTVWCDSLSPDLQRGVTGYVAQRLATAGRRD